MDRSYDIEDLKRLMERLRDPEYGCPWDLKQTYQSIAPFTLEECLELIDALEQSDFEHVEEELGDLLFQVIFYAQLGKEEGRFDFDSVVSGITVGFDFSSASDVSTRLLGEYRELEQAMLSGDQNEIENELGDVLFTVVNIARHLKVDSEAALRKTNRRFESRIRYAESDAASEGRSLIEESTERLDERWQKAKLKEKNKHGL
jgi:ATP diphosphatase